MLNLVNCADYNLKYYKNGNLLTKEFLLNILKNNEIYKKYLPDGVKYETLSKKFIFAVSIKFNF